MYLNWPNQVSNPCQHKKNKIQGYNYNINYGNFMVMSFLAENLQIFWTLAEPNEASFMTSSTKKQR